MDDDDSCPMSAKHLDPAHRKRLKRAVKRHHNLVTSRIKSRKGLGKRRYR